MTTPITEHAGKKYLRRIRSAVDKTAIEVDVYAVIKAFRVTCPARQHALKKILCAGQRDKASEQKDLEEAIGAMNRAVQLLAEDDA